MSHLQSELLSMAAHELKNPITTLKLATQLHLAKSRQSGSDRLTTNELELIDHELNRIIELVDDILDDTRIERGRLKMRFEHCDIIQLCKKIVSKMNQIYTYHTVTLIEEPYHNPIIKVDSSRIEQVLVNLISNAIKYSPDQPQINIRIRDLGKVIQISVQDYGIGILQSQHRLIFDKYYQVKTQKYHGFGLGLYISREIIKAHKGKIWVKSKIGQGSTFLFTLPKVKS